MKESHSRGHRSTIASCGKIIWIEVENRDTIIGSMDDEFYGNPDNCQAMIRIRGMWELVNARAYFMVFLGGKEDTKSKRISGCPPSDSAGTMDAIFSTDLCVVYFNGVVVSVLDTVGSSPFLFQRGIRARTIVHDDYLPLTLIRTREATLEK